MSAPITTSLGNPRFQATDTNGLPLAGGLLYTYTAGTSLPAPTYSDPLGVTANTNPVVLDSYGGAIVRGIGSYKFILKSPAGATLWSMDYIFMANLQDVIPADAALSAGRASVSATQAAASAVTSGNLATSASASAVAAAASAITSGNHATSAAASAVAASSSAGTATTQAGIATTQAGIAAGQASTATTQAGIAATQAGLAAASETNAAASAVTAAAQAAKLSGTSTTSLAIAVASNTFTTQSGKSFDVGTFLNITSDASPTTTAMYGQVTAYSGTSLTVNVTDILGSGTHTDWTIHAAGAGPKGASGTGVGDMLKSENLSGLANYVTARANLGLGNAATKSVGSSAGTVCAGDDTRLTGIPTGEFRNKIIGGDFTINPWQRGTTFTGLTTGVYAADRFRGGNTNDGAVDVLKTADAPTVAEAGVFTQHCLHVDVTTADASIVAAQGFAIVTVLEGLNVASFGFGQAGTRYATLSFWVKATKTGIYCVAFKNFDSSRAYIAEYTVNSSDVWEKKSITVPVDATGTWLYDTGAGIVLRWQLAIGPDLQGAAGSWQASNIQGSANQVNALDSASNNFKLALIQLEGGSVATPFEVRSAQTESMLCRRYYWQGAVYVPTTTAQNLRCLSMKATPTVGGGGSGITTTGTTADTLIGYQTSGAVQTITLSSEV